jgi:hypothetical protein
MSFDWADFMAPLDPWVIAMAFLLGTAMGALMRAAGHRPSVVHIYWKLAGGLVFFVPLALLRLGQGSPVWERLLATLPLWVIFVIGIWIGSRRTPRANP